MQNPLSHEGASVDAIAEAAGRTSGALYAHFGSKERLLIELLESWRNEVSTSITADLSQARTIDEHLLALWHDFAHPKGAVRQWVQLEHRWAQERLIPTPRADAGPAMIGLLIGLEMQTPTRSHGHHRRDRPRKPQSTAR